MVRTDTRWQREKAELLTTISKVLTHLQRSLADGESLMPGALRLGSLRAQLNTLGRQDRTSFERDPLQPGLRAALLALVEALVGANAAVLAALAAGNREEGLLKSVWALEALAVRALEVPGPGERAANGADLFVRLLPLAGAVTGSGRLAYAAGMRFLEYSHGRILCGLLQLLCGPIFRGPPSDVLRATSLRPQVVLECVMPIVREEAKGEGPPGRTARSELLKALFENDMFAPEREAIAADAEMQEHIVAALQADLEQFSEGAPPVESQQRESWYDKVYMAVMALVDSGNLLTAGIKARACADPSFLPALLACIARLLADPAPAELESVASPVPGVSPILFFGTSAVLSVYRGHTDGKPPLFKAAAALSCLPLAHAVGMRLLAAPASEARETWTVALAKFCTTMLWSMKASLHELKGTPRAAGEEVAGLYLPALRALEGFMRLAARLPWDPAREGDRINCRVNWGQLQAQVVAQIHGLPLPASEVVSAEALDLVTAAVESTVKHALVLADYLQTGAASAVEREARLTPFRTVGCVLGTCFNDMTSALLEKMGDSDVHPLTPAQLRRWQGLALAVWSAAQCLERARQQGLGDAALPGTLPFLLEAGGLIMYPEVRRQALATEAGRAAMLQVFEFMLGDETYAAVAPQKGIYLGKDMMLWNSVAWLKKDTEPWKCNEFARMGVLACITRWAKLGYWKQGTEEQVAKTGRKLVSAAFDSIAIATGAAGVPEIRAALAALSLEGDGKAYILEDASLWEGLERDVVAPLEAALRAAEGLGPEDRAQLAVEVAEALATRPCAHVRCTTLVGASEADQPRGKLCSGCRALRYCGPACQKADWRAHKAACRELQRRAAPGPGVSV